MMQRSWVLVLLGSVACSGGGGGGEGGNGVDPGRCGPDNASCCSSDSDCPIGFQCQQSLCQQIEQPPTPTPMPTPVPTAGPDCPAELRQGDDCVPPDGWAFIPSGTFMRGSPADEPGRDPDEGQHEVRITRPFLLAKMEVTQGEYRALLGADSMPEHSCGDDCPAQHASIADAMIFLNAMSTRDGLEECYQVENCTMVGEDRRCDVTAVGGEGALLCEGYRLPTDAEWEYAARAGETASRYGVLPDIAWFADNSDGNTHAVGSKAANAWGLHDMLGNVWEWTWDGYGPYPTEAVTDPTGPAGRSLNLARGCSATDIERLCRFGHRGKFQFAYVDLLGFRAARSLFP